MLEIAITDIANDLFAFQALIQQKIAPEAYTISCKDLVELNRLPKAHNKPDFVKVSIQTVADILDDYVLLPIGAAFSKANGPKIVSRKNAKFRAKPVLVTPGKTTSAALLAKQFGPTFASTIEVPYPKVLSTLAQGDADAAVVIHESAFDIQTQGLKLDLDLGLAWQKAYQLPLPLGGICAKRSLGTQKISVFISNLRASLEYAQKFRHQTIKEVCRQKPLQSFESVDKSVDQWVTKDTFDMSYQAIKAIMKFLHLSNKNLNQDQVFKY